MTADTDRIETVCEALADPECREILSELDEYRSAREVVDRCGVAKTSAYRKLDQLTDAGLVDERIEPERNGHHATEYRCDFSGILVTHETGKEFGLDVLKGSDSPDEQLASFWSQMSEEL
jgi:DNA-binding transcriptional ArsR family regulator